MGFFFGTEEVLISNKTYFLGVYICRDPLLGSNLVIPVLSTRAETSNIFLGIRQWLTLAVPKLIYSKFGHFW